MASRSFLVGMVILTLPVNVARAGWPVVPCDRMPVAYYALPPRPTGPVWARPRPAPPSPEPSTHSPPTQARKPPTLAVTEARFYDTYAVAARAGDRPAPALAAATFWNLTDRDTALSVNGQSRGTLARGKSLTLEVPRTFTWQVTGRAAQTEQVPPTDPGVEVVLRR